MSRCEDDTPPFRHIARLVPGRRKCKSTYLLLALEQMENIYVIRLAVDVASHVLTLLQLEGQLLAASGRVASFL